MALDPQLLAILTGYGNLQSGNSGYLPKFKGGQGLDQNLLAMLMAQGMLPKRIAGDGSYILPDAPQETYGFHSPSQLDNFKQEGSMASRMGPFFSNYGKVDTTPQDELFLGAQNDARAKGIAQGAMYPTAQEDASMAAIRKQIEAERKKRMGIAMPTLKNSSLM